MNFEVLSFQMIYIFMMITKIFAREKRQRKKERQASHSWDGDS